MGGVDSKALFKEAIQDLANKEQVSIYHIVSILCVLHGTKKTS